MDNTALKKEVWKEIVEARDKYAVPADQELPPFNRAKEMVACSLLIETMEGKRASHDEMMTVLKYCGIVLDCEKLHLNALQAYEDFGIDALCEKYIEGENKDEN